MMDSQAYKRNLIYRRKKIQEEIKNLSIQNHNLYSLLDYHFYRGMLAEIDREIDLIDVLYPPMNN